MLELLITLLLFGGGAVYLNAERKSGFSRTKKLFAIVRNGGNQLLHGLPTPQQKVERLVSGYASQVDNIRDGVAQLEANFHQSRKIAAEESKIAQEARTIAEQAMRKGKENEARQALVQATNSEERTRLYVENAEKYKQLAIIMREHLSKAEGELEMVKTSADTIRVHAEIAAMNRELYELISEVSASGGFTAQGQLKLLAEQTEREAIASSIKVDLARQGADGQRNSFRQLIQGDSIESEIEEIRKRIALPEGKKQDEQQEGQQEEQQEEHV